MKSVQFFGATGEVTGSGYLLISEKDEHFLIDFGMFQGSKDIELQNYAPLAFNAKNLKAVFLTHAHLDHCGRLPLLVKNGFHGKIYATDPTKQIATISLLDSAKISREHGSTPLYTTKDVEKTMNLFQVVPYDHPFFVEGFKITYFDAGHILGSASIKIEQNNQSIVFSGDLGNSPEDLIKPTEKIADANFVVIESTYGDSVHPQEDVVAILRKEINEVEKSGGVLLIPAFSVERTQEIIHKIGHLKNNSLISKVTPVYLDSPMAIEVTEIFKKFPNLYNSELSHDQDPFDFAGLTCINSVEESKAIMWNKGVKIIIAGSGMMSGGRILHHLKNYISLPTTRLLIVGYQAVETLGRQLEEGAKTIELYGQIVSVNATITKLESLSSHADQPKLLNWLKNIHNVKEVFVVHGEDHQRSVLTEKIKSDIGIQNVKIPQLNQTLPLN